MLYNSSGAGWGARGYAPPHIGNGSNQSMGCREVTLVEDDADLRSAFVDVLRLTGYEVSAFSHGLEALEYLRAHGEDVGLIVLDLEMPVMDGLAFLDARKDDLALLAIPVLVLTATPPESLESARLVGVLEKPVSSDVLLETIERYCGRPATPTAVIRRSRRSIPDE